MPEGTVAEEELPERAAIGESFATDGRGPRGDGSQCAQSDRLTNVVRRPQPPDAVSAGSGGQSPPARAAYERARRDGMHGERLPS